MLHYLLKKQYLPPENRCPLSDTVYLTQSYTYGMHPYRTAGEDSTVYFVDEDRKIAKMLVDAKGHIQHFPGIVKEDFWVSSVSQNALRPQIRFRTDFSRRNDRWLMCWQIQPDGWYWADEGGFGGEHDAEVILYTYIDKNGNFTGPFQIYSINSRVYSLDYMQSLHFRSYDKTLDKLRSGDLDRNDLFLFPWLKKLDENHGCKNYSNNCMHKEQDILRYMADPLLSQHLMECCQVLLTLDREAYVLKYYPLNTVIHGSMTMFYLATQKAIFKEVLDKFFDGKLNIYTASALDWQIGFRGHLRPDPSIL